MSYTLQYSLGNITVTANSINQQTTLSLPGQNFVGYGQYVDQNQLSMLENFASANTSGPGNAIPGQTWFNSATGVYSLNTSANSVPSWTPVVLDDGNISFTTVVTQNLVVSGVANIATANVTTANIANTTVTGTANIATANITTANITTANITNETISGVANIATANVTALVTTSLSTGSNSTAGTITGDWTLTAGSTLQATYADLAERFEADAYYDAGTVVELGGAAEITAVRGDASEQVFGVVSDSAGMIMNGAAGTDATHPKIAMTGRVPVKVVGVVRKGDRLISAGDGVARSAQPGEATVFNIVGRALEDKLTTGNGKVLAAVSARP